MGGGGYRSRYDNMVRLLYSVVGTIYSYEGGSRLRSCIKLISLGVGRGKFQSNLPKCFDMTTIGYNMYTQAPTSNVGPPC